MSEFDDYLKAKAAEEPRTVPPVVEDAIRNTLSDLPETIPLRKKSHIAPKIATIAAGFFFVCLIVLPNVSPVYAQTLEKIPVLSHIVQVVTFRNYTYADDHHEMSIDVPKIEGETNGAADYINQDVEAFTQRLYRHFQEELEELGNAGYTGLYVDYEVVTNTDRWFTLKIRVLETAGSSNTYYKYYHINKANGQITQLSDLAADDRLYEVLEAELTRQMRQAMADDSDLIYWVDSSPFGQSFETLDADHNFYWNEEGDLVIVFDKYEVAPGSMGTPEFAIPRERIQPYLREEFQW